MMRALICDNTARDASGRMVSIFSIKEKFEEKCNYDFKEETSENDVIFSYACGDDGIIIRQVGEYGDQGDKEKEISKLKEVIDKFVDDYPDGFVVVHLGVIGTDRSNYYMYPSVRAVRESRVNEQKVIFYTTFNISDESFKNETSQEYHIVGTTEPKELVDQLMVIMKQ